MPTEGATGIEVVVWRPHNPPYEIAFVHAESSSYLYLSEGAQRDVFRWRTREDLWGGLQNNELRQMLREQLIMDFDPFKKPRDRTIEKFGEFISRLRQLIDDDAVAWSVSTQGYGVEEDPVLINSIIALYKQLRWIYQIYRDVPGASVTVR